MGLLNILFHIKPNKTQANKISGQVGEEKVRRKLNPLIFGKVNHRLINNLILVDNLGHTHQIDHIEIRRNGIFCIETKNYKGLIFGSENNNNWTQVLNKKKYTFVNPLKQNASHIYQISNVLNHRYHINTLVVMVNNNARNVNISNVINLSSLNRYLAMYDDGTSLSNDEMTLIYNTLCASNTKISNKEHVNNIKQAQRNINNGICPRCGKTLVLRNGKYGNFYGCSNYPKCKFTLNIK